MNKKYIVAFTFLITGLVTIVMGTQFKSNSSRLKGDASSTSNYALSFVCNKTSLSVNEETDCTLLINVSDYKIGGFQGTISSSSNIQISNISSPSDNWYVDDTNLMLTMKNDVGYLGRIELASFRIKALSGNSGEIRVSSYKPNDSETMPMLVTVVESLTSVELTDKSLNISIDDGGSTPPTVSSNANLSSLSVTFPPETSNKISSFNKNTLEYSVQYTDANIVNGQVSVSLDATKEDSNASISGTGTFTFTEVSKSYPIVVTAQDGTKKTYKVNFSKSASVDSNNHLKSLSVNTGTLTPTFDSATQVYSVTVPNTTTKITINAQKASNKATVSGDGEHTLNVGTNEFDIIVKAENNDVRTYKVKVNREAEILPDKSDDNNLKSLTLGNLKLTPSFSSNQTNYTAVATDDISTINIVATPNDSKAKIDGDGEKTLINGRNTFIIKVTAENNKIKTYSIIVTKGNEEKVPTTCELKISSSVYKIDYDNLTVVVDKNHNDATIKNNITVDCGTIEVSNEKIIVRYENETKEYKINRVFLAQTGNNIVKYSILIGSILIAIGISMFIIFKSKK